MNFAPGRRSRRLDVIVFVAKPSRPNTKTMSRTQLNTINFGHTPDADDAFMWFALTTEKLTLPDLKIKHLLKSMQELNVDAQSGLYEISAISFGAYAQVAHLYDLLPCGGCLGFGYGPMLLSNRAMSVDELAKAPVAVPGMLTTATFALKLFAPELQLVQLPFDKIVSAIQSGEVAAGLIIHEAQMTYKKMGFTKIVDLGEWWQEQTNLPLPLGGNIIRKDLPAALKSQVATVMQNAIRYSLAHRQEALAFAMQWARGIPADQADQFIGMYVNESTVDYGEVGRKAITELYARAYKKGILKDRLTPNIIEI
jgi:1,4-dihydroxy-6-naphthoate synthase